MYGSTLSGNLGTAAPVRRQTECWADLRNNGNGKGPDEKE